MIFVITEIVCIPTGTSSILKKKKTGKESQFIVLHPELGLDPPFGSNRESGCDMFNMAVHKKVLVADVWDFSRAEGGWSLVFVRDFNDWEMEEVERFLQILYRRKIMSHQEDQLLLKGAKEAVFSTRLIYKKMVQPHPPPPLFLPVPYGILSFPLR